MDKGLSKNADGNWEAPLPFKVTRPRLPNNKNLAYKRAKSLEANLRKDPTKRAHFITFMDEILRRGHAEVAPPVQENEEVWYLPIFGVYHPQKKDQIRAVFDSSAELNGISLNKVLLTGPDLTNSLLGVLMRFRQGPVGIMADIQKMFYCFYVNPEHRNYLRFFWYRDNDLSKDLIEFRMCVHVFGNTTSPAVATYGLRKTAFDSEEVYGSDVRQFVERNFYVDDALTSLATTAEAISLLKRTQEALETGGNLKLHKVASNSQDVLAAFPNCDLARGLKDLDLSSSSLPSQRSLGLNWNLDGDTFAFNVAQDDKPYTRRGVLSRVNSLYDPLGFIAPTTIQGRLLLRKVVSTTDDWDKPLPDDLQEEWKHWVESLQELNTLTVPRTYSPIPIYNAAYRDIHVFSDASEKAIGAVAYIRTHDEQGNIHLGFVLGKSKLAPSHGHTIPRLELCGAVLAVEIAESIAEHLDLQLSDFKFYSDSRVVLGYIHNESRRFHTYVANRVSRIRQATTPSQWSYVSTESNPADLATRSVSPSEMANSMWLSGPPFLLRELEQSGETSYEIENPHLDKEVRAEVRSCKTNIDKPKLSWPERFEKFSRWNDLVAAISCLKRIAYLFHNADSCIKDRLLPRSVNDTKNACTFILHQVQRDSYYNDICCIKEGKPLPKDSAVSSLNPVLDEEDVLRVGGRLQNSNLDIKEKKPVLIPGKSHIARLLVLHFHNLVKHQGRHITAGAIRSAGYWITGGKSLISSLLHRCVICRKLRGKTLHQKMADLPCDRVEPGPPFTNVGVDCFGPWQVVSRRTRGGQANSKRWGVLFTCLTSRAVHIEAVEELSSSSFINALRRFLSIRGTVKIFRSDRGTNFIGATDDLKIHAINCEDREVSNFLNNSGCTWIFNPPHASHMGGAWERMIGVTRRILDTLLLEVPGKGLTHEVLVTFLAEASAIINSRPITTISSDPEEPYPLSPSLLLTQKPNRIENINLPLNGKDLYRAQWKRVQILADMFWRRWCSEYLQNLQESGKMFKEISHQVMWF
ncbi:uncharacterized protein [Argopecten irradians]|uniref:uncharacterized protein n=1 Tax=Argopecten irradians TaxID=31199 RepID=UPI003710DC50